MNPKNSFTAACIQMSCSTDKQENLDKIETQIRQAADKQTKLVLLQELHNSPYFCQTQNVDNFALAEPIPGPSCDLFSKLSHELEIVIVASLFENRSPGIYHNTAVVFDVDGRIADQYRKMHIPDDPGFMEKFYFTPGDLGFKPITTKLGKLGVLICWDQWFPEAARLMALAGADLLLYPTAIGWDPRDDQTEHQRQLEAWQTIQRSHAIANGIPLLVCNRVGFESNPEKPDTGIQFWGHSFIAGQQGEILATATGNEEIIRAEINLQRNHEVQRIWPFFRDRRIDSYGDLIKRYIDG